MMEKQIEVPKKILNFLTGIYYEYNEDKDSRKRKFLIVPLIWHIRIWQHIQLHIIKIEWSIKIT